jgi:Kae1-associated kinase Bud32
MEQLLSQGAEAIIIKKDFSVIKTRREKKYRLPLLDNMLRSSRTKREIKIFEKLVELKIPTPRLLSSDDFSITMGYIDGVRLRDRLLDDFSFGEKLERIGLWIAQMHNEGIIHGDLTTSNILVDQKDDLFLIDFGLSFFSQKVEDKAVDIHLLEQALESTHYEHAKEFFTCFKKGYVRSSEHAVEVFDRLKEVHMRGRNK